MPRFIPISTPPRDVRDALASKSARIHLSEIHPLRRNGVRPRASLLCYLRLWQSLRLQFFL